MDRNYFKHLFWPQLYVSRNQPQKEKEKKIITWILQTWYYESIGKWWLERESQKIREGCEGDLVWHLSPHWSLRMIQLIWLTMWVSLSSLIIPCVSLSKLHTWLKRTAIPDRGGPVFSQGYLVEQIILILMLLMGNFQNHSTFLQFFNYSCHFFYWPMSVSSENLKRTQKRHRNVPLFKSVNPILYIFTILHQSVWLFSVCVLKQIGWYLCTVWYFSIFIYKSSTNLFLEFWDLIINHFAPSWVLRGFDFSSLCYVKVHVSFDLWDDKIWHFSFLWFLSDRVWSKWDTETSRNFLSGKY